MEYVQNTAENRAAAIKRAVENCETFISTTAQGETDILRRELHTIALQQLEPIELVTLPDPKKPGGAGILIRRFR